MARIAGVGVKKGFEKTSGLTNESRRTICYGYLQMLVCKALNMADTD